VHWLHDDLAVSGLHDLHLGEPIGAVLNVCERRPYDPPQHLEYLHKGFPDIQPFPLDTVWDCVQWVDSQVSAGKKVLVHCAEGNSRSVTIVIGYLMYKGHKLQDIQREVLKRKPYAHFFGKPTETPQYFNENFLRRFEAFLVSR
jgi:protein-tyrosine phosphatase